MLSCASQNICGSSAPRSFRDLSPADRISHQGPGTLAPALSSLMRSDSRSACRSCPRRARAKHIFLCARLRFINKSGSRLLFHTVSSIVPSAVQVLTVVFGMRTGVAPARIATRQILLYRIRHSHEMLRISDWSRPEALRALSAPADGSHLPVNQSPVRCLPSPGVPDF